MKNKSLYYIVVGSVLLAAVIILLQIWTDMLLGEIFGKLLATLAIIGVVAGFLIVAKSDFQIDNKFRDENYLD
ncbi:MAG: hypothetical protein ACT4OY_07260 [Alphaproteobacteria bacterium]